MISLAGVASGYGKYEVLHDISLSVSAGERVGILGRNGVGKTALMRCIAGLAQAHRGTITLDEIDITKRAPHLRARMGIALVPQGRWIFPFLSVRDNLRLAGYATGRSDVPDRLDWVLEQFPALKPKLRAEGGSLSGGQQQILALSRALMTEPRVLLLDEPSEGIQPSVVDEITERVVELSTSIGLTVVLVEQNLEMAARMTTRCYLLDHGELVREVESSQILADKDLQHEYLGV